MSDRGELALVLHTHMPYVEGFGTWPFGEEWLWEAVATVYLPLLRVLEEAPVTVGLTPVLCDQLETLEGEAGERFLRFLREIRAPIHGEDEEGFERAGEEALAAEVRRAAADYRVADRAFGAVLLGSALELDFQKAVGNLLGSGHDVAERSANADMAFAGDKQYGFRVFIQEPTATAIFQVTHEKSILGNETIASRAYLERNIFSPNPVRKRSPWAAICGGNYRKRPASGTAPHRCRLPRPMPRSRSRWRSSCRSCYLKQSPTLPGTAELRTSTW